MLLTPFVRQRVHSLQYRRDGLSANAQSLKLAGELSFPLVGMHFLSRSDFICPQIKLYV